MKPLLTLLSPSAFAGARSLTLRALFLCVFLVTGLFSASAAAQQDHTFVNLSSVHFSFDGTEERVTIDFETDGQDSCFVLLADQGQGDQDPQRSVVSLCSQTVGQNSITLSRTFFLGMSLFDNLYLRSILRPIVQSARVRATGDLALHSVTDLGSQVEIVYSASFDECVSLINNADQFLFVFSTTLCRPGLNQTALIDREDLVEVTAGQTVRLRVIGRNDLTTLPLVVGAPEPAQACVLATEELRLQTRAEIFSDSVYAGREIHLQNSAKIVGDVRGLGNARLDRNSLVDGDLTLGGYKSGQGSVSGLLTEHAVVEPEELDSISVQCSHNDVRVPDYRSITLVPGAYGDLVVGRNAKLTLQSGGNYTFESVQFGDRAELLLDTATGAYDLRVRNEVRLGVDFRTRGVAGSTVDAKRVAIVTDEDATIGRGAQLSASLSAPSGDVILRNRSRVMGCVKAEEIKVGVDAKIDAR